MKKLDLSPTEENILLTLEKNVLGRNEEIKDFLGIIDNIEGNMSIAINGDWGCGKTFYIKQIYEILNYMRNQKFDIENNKRIEEIVKKDAYLSKLEMSNSFVPVYYDAWLYDDNDDIIASLMISIIKTYGKVYSTKVVTSSLLEKVASVLDIFSFGGAGTLTNAIEKNQVKDILDSVKTSEEIMSIMDEIFNQLIVEKANKLVVFIDELDRCRPDFAIRLLEKIKHFIDDDRIIFVYSINKNELCHTINKFYGNEFNSTKYLNKFFDLSFELNNSTSVDYVTNLRLINNDGYYINILIFELIKIFSFSMRECNKYIQGTYKGVDIVRNSSNNYFDTMERHVDTLFFPIVAALKIYNNNIYNKLISGDGANELLAIYEKSPTMKKYMFNILDDKDSITRDDNARKEIVKIYETIFTDKYKDNDNNDSYRNKERIKRLNMLLNKI
ncbi:KAP family P-loop NTPase fold protein [[Clostridium] fimetarium]|uniref:KAP family P-loop domain-containing protein n=1 Tax=[Clostridium] fimetarium TaxID=99656 RepID=A0A1I0RDS4_9FIRM|nr:P-loop NTPase fold protein [[Clostridium] fimetarium]SEW38893.1 KAP family P-loop domain-containing protein [[Clostridium] fimetarium]